MFALLDIRDTGLSGAAFAASLLEAEHVAVMPGESFGSALSGWLRLALSQPDDTTAEACTRIARHAAMDFWRKKYRRRDQLFSDLDDPALVRVEATQQERLAEQQADREAQDSAREWLAAALLRLSPDDRAVITLVELEDRSMEDAARRLGCGLSAVKVRAFRARRRLKAILEDLRPGKDEPA